VNTKILWTPCTSNFVSGFSHMVAYRSFSKNTRKINLQPILNKNSPHAYTELELDMLGCQKACEIFNLLIQMKKWNKIYFHYPRVPKLQKTSFWSQFLEHGIQQFLLSIQRCSSRRWPWSKFYLGGKSFALSCPHCCQRQLYGARKA
jgi:hypothetical protein